MCNMIHDGIWEVSQVFNNNPQGIRLRIRPNTECGIVYKEMLVKTDINKWKITVGKRGQKNT